MINEIVTLTFAFRASSLFKCLDKLLIILFLLVFNNNFFHSILVSIRVLEIVAVSVQLHINYFESIKCLKCIRILFLHLQNCFETDISIQWARHFTILRSYEIHKWTFATKYVICIAISGIVHYFFSLLFSSLLFSHALPFLVFVNSIWAENEHSSTFSYVEIEWNVSQNNCYFIHFRHINVQMLN